MNKLNLVLSFGAEMADEKEKAEVITAIYKVNLHCHQCWREIKKPLSTTQGIQSVEVKMEKNEISVKGSNLDVLKIHKRIEKLSKKKVELISPKPKPKEVSAKPTPNNPKQIKLIHRTITAKVHLHCAKCEQDLKNTLLKHTGIYSVKTDMKAQTLTMEGTIEPEKFKSYMKKKLHKHVDITVTVDKKSSDSSKPPPSEKKKKESIEKENPKPSSGTTTAKIVADIQIKHGDNVNNNNNVPYFIHYVYAPQLFSDENPNACTVM